MPISQLQSINQTPKESFLDQTVDYIQDTLKKPFSWKALIISLSLGLGVAVIVTSILLGFKYFISNNSSQSKVTSFKAPATSYKVAVDISHLDTDRDGIYDWQESFYGTNPYMADTDFDGYPDLDEIKFGFDPTGFGRPAMDIKIEKLSLEAPISFPVSINEADIQKAMAEGVAHYPGTAIPGEPGNIYLTGHSSDYAWNPGNFKYVFRKLNQLEAGDRVVITQTLNSGHKVKFEYQVYDKQVTAVDDPKLWQVDRGGSVITLVTSWPLDTTRERLMVRGILVE